MYLNDREWCSCVLDTSGYNGRVGLWIEKSSCATEFLLSTRYGKSAELNDMRFIVTESLHILDRRDAKENIRFVRSVDNVRVDIGHLVIGIKNEEVVSSL